MSTAQIQRERIFSREAGFEIACGFAFETDCPQIRNHRSKFPFLNVINNMPTCLSVELTVN